MTGLALSDALALAALDAHGQAELVRRGELSAAELVEAAVLRIEAIDPAVNAVSYRAFEQARAAAAEPRRTGPLAGVPYLVKDSLHYPGFPARAGSRSKDDRPSSEAFPFIRSFEGEGLVAVGKSSMAEFGLLVSNEPLRYGPTRNPWDLARSPGGSSGGAAAAVAAGLVPLAHGSDAAGSIRVPAAACGVVGLKPSRGGNLRARAAHWLDDLLCSDGMIAGSVRDAAWAFAVASPGRPVVTRPAARRLKIGVMMEGMTGADPEPDVAQAISEAGALCAELGHHVEELRRPSAHADLLHGLLDVLWAFLGAEAVEHFGAAALEPWTCALAERVGALTPLELERAIGCLAAAPAADAEPYAHFDVVLSPATASVAPLTGELAPTVSYPTLLERFTRFAPYTSLQNMAGSTAISLPLGAGRGGLPVGAMFAAARGQEELLLALALELEAARPWSARRPQLAHVGSR